MHKLTLIVFLTCFFHSSIGLSAPASNQTTNIQQTYTITPPPTNNCGFFCCFFETLYSLLHCPREQTPVIIWRHFLYYNEDGFNDKQNGWEYYFEPLTKATANNVHMGFPSGPLNYAPKTRMLWNAIINHYVHIRPIVQQKIDQFYAQHMAHKKTIGIHIRGTDKHLEVKPISLETIITEALKHADHETQFLIATDEQQLLERATEMLKPYTVIHYDCYRSPNSQPIHYIKDPTIADSSVTKPSPAQLGEDVLIEALLLSKCDLFIHTYSNVSMAVAYFNPDLKHVLLQSDQMRLNLL